jgi:hypothetical protein
MPGDQFTLHRRVWAVFSRLPRLTRILMAIVALGALVEIVLLSGSNRERSVRAAMATAVREATGSDPASSCSALSPVGLSEVVSQFGDAHGATAGAEPLAACRQLVPRLRAQMTPQQLTDFANGSVRAVQFRSDGSALVIYLAADHRFGAQLTMSDHAGRWLIDSVAGGTIAGAQ